MRSLAAVVSAVLLLLPMAACSYAVPAAAERPTPASAAPPAPSLDTPEAAVRSYLAWASYAYRVGESAVASPTMTDEEAVRVDAYLELNRQRGRRIEQRLTSFTVRSSAAATDAATVAAAEEWTYRYVPLVSDARAGGAHSTSYETTYTLVRAGDSWLVDKVAVRALGRVE